MSSGSIYRSPEGEAEIMALYDEALAGLRVECKSRMVGTGFGETHVLVTGPEDAPPVVVLQGGNFVNPLCLAWFLPLARENRVFAPDIMGQPGRGAQNRLSARGDEQARWMVDVLDGLGLDRVPFVGISFGAGVILRVAGYAPERVSRAALVSPAGVAMGPALRMLKDVALPMFRYRLRPSRERLISAARPILTDLDDIYLRQLGLVYRHVRLDRNLPRAATEQELSGYDSPTLLFTSDEDIFFPPEAVVPRAREVIPNLIATETLSGCRHVPSKQAFAHVNERISAFLREA